MTDQTPSTERVERARFEVASRHHFHGELCLCDPDRHRARSRDRTEHILDAFIKELDLDAWLAARDREVAAKALRDAAEAFSPAPHVTYTRDQVSERLWAIADRIGAGDE